MNVRSTLFGLTVLAALTSPLACMAQPEYSFTNFDGPVAANAAINSTTINSISNAGLVVGSALDSNGNLINFTGVPVAFSPLNISSAAVPNGINTSQQVVGMNGTSAFVLNSVSASNQPLPLPSVNGTTTSEAAFGINDSGIIVGQYTDSATNTTPGFIDVAGAFTTLIPFPTLLNKPLVVNAQGINNSGLVVGYYAQNNLATNQHGFLYDSLTMSYTLLADPNTAQTANGNLALTQFLGINDSGLAVGYYQTKDNNSQFGFLYDTKTNNYMFLDDPAAIPTVPGGQITQITGIANSGEIAGFFVNQKGVQQGFTAIPVPETSSLLGLGLLLILGGVAQALRTSCRRAGKAA